MGLTGNATRFIRETASEALGQDAWRRYLRGFLLLCLAVPSMAVGATRFYMQNAIPDVTIATHRGAWDDTTSVLQRKLSRTKAGTIASNGVAEATITANYDVLVLKLVSEPITAAQTISGTLGWTMGTLESSGNLNAYWHVHVYVTQGNTDTLRGTLYTDYTETTNEWPTTAQGWAPNGAITLSPVVVQANDRIVIEVGYRASASSLFTRTGTLWYGGANATDLTSGGDETTLPGWWEFSQDMFPAFDHVRVEHNGSGDTCGAKSLTVKACLDAGCTSLYSGSVTTTLSASAGSWGTNPITFSGGSTTVGLTETSPAIVTVGASKPGNATSSSDCYDTAAGNNSCSISFTNCLASCTATLSGVANTYYPPAAAGAVAAGATSITLGASAGNSTQLATNDLVLIVQMQDATINATNSSAYGANNGTGSGATSLGNSGLYEYKQVQSFNAGTGVVTFTSPLVNSYSSAAATLTAGQKAFQVIRVPVLANYTLATAPTALAWNGSVGGVLAFDVAGTLTFSGNPTISVDGVGFRGAATRNSGSGSGSNTDYRTNAGSNGANGSKGEGIAGTPSTSDSAGAYGYPSGSNARGAPANAGGGGTDGNPAANDQNTGGGGGAGYGNGGIGGIAWCGSFNAGAAPYYNCPDGFHPTNNFNDGGIGGTGVTQSATLLTMGGGGGSATSNNNFDTSGADGGGLIFVRAGSLSGSATFSATGAAATNTTCNDGTGGGGGGGAVLIQVGSGSGLNNVTINVNGGQGGTNLIPAGCGSGVTPHGPGGGGGGGYAVTSVVGSGSSAPAACNRNGGIHGDTYNNGVLFGAYGSANGSVGACSSTTGTISVGAAFGVGPCAASLNHIRIIHDGSAIACSPESVTVRACANIDCSSLYTGGVTGSLTAGGAGGNAVPFTIPGSASDTTVSIHLPTNSSGADPQTVRLGASSLSVTATDSASPYCLNTVTSAYNNSTACDVSVNKAGLVLSVPTLTAGIASGAATIQAIRSSDSSTCVPLFAGVTRTVAVWGNYLNPTTGTMNVLVNGGGVETTSSPAYTSTYSLAFDATGTATLTSVRYDDVGQMLLGARYVGSTGNSPPDGGMIASGTTSFVVKPYGFKLSSLTCAAADKTSSASGAFCVAGGTFTGAATAVRYDSTAANNLGAATPNFGHESTAQTVTFSPYALVNPTVAAGGTLSAFSSSLTGSFSGTPNQATVTLVWPEVGTITIRPSTNYLGTGDFTAAGISDSAAFAGNIGRFYPHHFTLVSGGITPACATGGFTYMGQPNLGIAFTVEARNKADVRTANYLYAATGGYANLGTVTLAAENANAGTDLGARLGGLGSTNWTGGAYAASATAATFSRLAAADGAYDSLAIGVKVSDADAALAGMNMRADTTGACTTGTAAATDCTAVQIGSATKVRYGRLRFLNAYGSELLDLRVPVRAEYYSGGTWLLNSSDSCTSIANPRNDIALGNCTGSLSCASGGNMDPATHLSTTAVTLSGGTGTIALTRPTCATGPCPTGGVDLVLTLGSSGTNNNCVAPALPAATSGAGLAWLQYPWCTGKTDPNARATFGVAKNRFIYLRERY